MEDILIVDGYNILHAAPSHLKIKDYSLAHLRSLLISFLSDYQGYRKNKIIVVFDGKQEHEGKEQIEIIEGITTIFSKDGETADTVIEKMVEKYRDNQSHHIIVATSDYAQQRLVFSKGAFRMTAREFWLEIFNSKDEVKNFFNNGKNTYKRQVSSRINQEVSEILEKWRREK